MLASIFGLIYHTHAATAQLLQDAVMGDGLADHVDGSPTRGRNPTLCSKVSQTDMGGGDVGGQVSDSADLRAVGLECPSQAAAWMSRTCEVVMG